MSLIDQLVALRKEKGLSQNQMAKLLGITQSTVSKLEHRDMTFSEAEAYANALGYKIRVHIMSQEYDYTI